MSPENTDQPLLSLTEDAEIISAVRSGNIDRLNKALARLGESNSATKERPHSKAG